MDYRQLNVPGLEQRASKIPSFNEALNQVLRGMLRTAYGYAGDHPEEIYLYLQLEPDGVTADVLFRLNGHLVEVHELNMAGLAKTFDVSEKRQLELRDFLAQDIQNELLPLFRRNHTLLPDEIWASYRLHGDRQDLRLGYRFQSPLPDIQEGLDQWKAELAHPGASPWVQWKVSDDPTQVGPALDIN